MVCLVCLDCLFGLFGFFVCFKMVGKLLFWRVVEVLLLCFCGVGSGVVGGCCFFVVFVVLFFWLESVFRDFFLISIDFGSIVEFLK